MAKKIKDISEIKSEKEEKNSQYFNLDEEKAFFDEVDEEVKNEKFKQFLQKYSGVLLTVLILALSITVGYEKIGEWKIRKAEQKNVQYVQALAPSSDYENNIAELESIVASEKGLYRDMARLQIANILLDNDQKDRALEILQQIYDDKDATSKIKEIATIKLATYKIDSMSYSELANMLMPVTENANSSWKNMAQELLAMSAIQHGDFENAKKIYTTLLADSNISDEFKSRINDMLASISDAENNN